jgi:hypothetical protein
MRKLAHWLLFALALFAVGCGGGGGGGGASGGASIFLTDDLTTNYSAVWVKIYKVDLVKQDGGKVTVFSDAAGKVFNLRALNDGNPRYAFLGKDQVPEGVYTGIEFSLDKRAHLVPNGSSNANQRDFDDSYISGSNPNWAILTILFPSPKTITGDDNELICDFVLAQWKDNGTKIYDCVVEDGPRDGFGNGDRHDHDDWEGNIANLSGEAPNYTFNLRVRAGNIITVTTDSSTAVFNSNGDPNPQLANGKRVKVRGVFNPATKTVAARTIKIKNGDDDEDPHEVKGLAKEVAPEAGTFDVLLGEAEGFTPTADFVHVATTASTRFFSQRGVLLTREQFFAAIAGGAKKVEAEGVWSAETNTLAAIKAKIEDDDDDDAEARGAPSAINAEAGTFSITLDEWEGFSSSRGSLVSVVTNGSTRFRDGEGREVTKEQFFTLLTSAAVAKVEGAYLNGTITAKQARIRNSGGGGGGGNGEAEARGVILNLNLEAKTFDLRLNEWSGFDGSANQVIHVAFTLNATFRDEDGETISKEAFFSKLFNGCFVEAEGSWSSGSQTLTAYKAKIEDD